MTAPTEKHREAARELMEPLADALHGCACDDCAADAIPHVSQALANAEREGMKRAAEIDAKALEIAATKEAEWDGRTFGALGRADKQRYRDRLADAINAYHAAILSESGEADQ